MSTLLRIVSGRRAGAVFVLRGRTVIGRSGHVDIQLLNETVSRQHAKLTLDEEGQVTLTDLSSDNGTFVNGEAIKRCVLEVGDTIAVGDTRFILERTPSDDAIATSPELQSRATSTDSLRQTAAQRVVPLTASARKREPGEYAGGRVSRREKVLTPVGIKLPGRSPRATPIDPHGTAAARTGSDPERTVASIDRPHQPIRHVRQYPTPPGIRPASIPKRASDESGSAFALRQDDHDLEVELDLDLDLPDADPSQSSTSRPILASERVQPTAEYPAVRVALDEPAPIAATQDTYGEDALLDVLAYRHLRLRSLRGDPLDAKERARFATLERRLERQAEDNDALALQRRFHRFACALPVRIRLRPTSEGTWGHVGRMLDLSAGGAQIAIVDAVVQAGTTIWVSFDLRRLDRPDRFAAGCEVVLESRVIWCSPEGTRLGIIFSGDAIFAHKS